LLFFGGWHSPFPNALFAWSRFLPTLLFAGGGLLLFFHGLRYLTRLGRILLPVLGLVFVGLGVLCALPGVVEFVQGPFWFLSKVFVFLFVYIWTRGTLPRFRYDQLMAFGWKLLLPLSLANAMVTGLVLVWKELP
jgi:NADH-quinone oxidoreductase subunit H